MRENRTGLTASTDGIEEPPPSVVVMGVAGSGKSTVGRELALRLEARFVDADDLHPLSNIEKMGRGIPLTDTDRWPWLDLVGFTIATANEPTVVACSALRRCYRDVIRQHVPKADFVFLHGSTAVLAERLDQRSGHFMRASMLESQLANLEPLSDDERGIRLDVSGSPSSLVAQVLDYLGCGPGARARKRLTSTDLGATQ